MPSMLPLSTMPVINGSNAKHIQELTSLEGESLNQFSRLVTEVAFSPNHKSIAVGTYDSAIHVYDLEGGTRRRMNPDHIGGGEAGITALSFSPDGKVLAAGTAYGMTGLWDVESGQQTFMLLGYRHEGNPVWPKNLVRRLTFTPDSRYLVVGASEYHLLVYDLVEGVRILSDEQEKLRSNAVLNPQGDVLAAAGNFTQSDGTSVAGIKGWAISSGSEVMWFHETDLEQKDWWNLNLEFDSTGTWLVGVKSLQVWVWDWRANKLDRKLVLEKPYGTDGESLHLHGDHWKTASNRQDGLIYVHSLQSGKLLATLLEKPAKGVSFTMPGTSSQLAFHPLHNCLAYSGKGLTLALWDSDNSVETVIDSNENPLGDWLAFSPDGKLIVTWPREVRVWGIAEAN